MKFVNLVKYRDLDRIASTRTAHFAYADRLRAEGRLAIGGPLMDEQGRRIGLLFIYEATSRDEALAIARDDPFATADALASCEIREWRLRGVRTDLLVEAQRAAHEHDAAIPPARLFATHARYRPDGATLAATRPAHWEYDQGLEKAGKLVLAGAFADDAGGLFVYRATSRADAMSYLVQDPFTLRKVFAEVELREWLIEGLNPALLVRDRLAGDERGRAPTPSSSAG